MAPKVLATRWRRPADWARRASAIRKSISRWLGVAIIAPLFHRSKRQVTLTRAGEVMLEESHRVLDQAERAVSHIRDVAHGHMGRVEIGLVLTASYELLPRVTRAFRRANPNIHVELHSMNSADMIRALQERHIDIAFLRPPLAAILPEDHPLADRERVDLADLMKPLYVMVPMPGWHTPFQTRIDGVCQANSIEPEIIHDPIHLVSLIAAGMGAGIGPRASRRLQLDGVVFRDLDGVPDDLNMEFAMAWRTNAASRVTTAFRETAIEVARDLNPTMDEDRPLFKDSVG